MRLPLAHLLALLVAALLTAPSAGAQSMEEADALFQAGRWEEAAAAYEALTAASETPGRAAYQLGLVYLQLDRPAEAAAVLENLVEASPSPPALLQLAKAHALRGANEETAEALRRAAEAGFAGLAVVDADPAFDGQRAEPAFVAAREQIERNAFPCRFLDEHRQFDFWVGTWDVLSPQGQRVGHNVITRADQECMLEERWTSASGGTGMSINLYHPGKERWVQHWVAASYVIDLEGGLVDGAMVLEGELVPISGTPSRLRGTWTPLPDGRVRQFFEQSTDGGATWTTWFDGYYVRAEEAEGS